MNIFNFFLNQNIFTKINLTIQNYKCKLSHKNIFNQNICKNKINYAIPYKFVRIRGIY